MSNELYLNDTNLKDPVQDLNDPLADPTQSTRTNTTWILLNST
jgi:hypothetical protein